MQIFIISCALLLAGANMADAKHADNCTEQQARAAEYWKESGDHYEWKCEKIEHIYEKALSNVPDYKCRTEYESYVEWHYNKFADKCDEKPDCKIYQKKAANNWEKTAGHLDYDCKKIDHIHKKTLSKGPKDECEIVYKSYVQWHYNQFDDKCEAEPDCKVYQKQAAKYWDKTADHFDNNCKKIDHIYTKTLSKGPKDECKTKYESYVKWHYNQFNDQCDAEPECKKYQAQVAKYWKQSADHYDNNCKKIDHIFKKTLSNAPKHECNTEFKSYAEWHYNELANSCW